MVHLICLDFVFECNKPLFHQVRLVAFGTGNITFLHWERLKYFFTKKDIRLKKKKVS